jgi:hypothetical protein
MSRFKVRAARMSAAIAPLFFVAATFGESGYTFDVNMKVEGSESTEQNLKVMVAGEKLRAERQGGEGPSVMIIQGPGKGMLMVNDKDKTYLEMAAPDSMMRAMRAMMGGMEPPKPEVSDTKVQAEDLGDGPAIDGHPTKHQKFTEAATVKMNFMGNDVTSRTETTTEYFFATDLKAVSVMAGRNPFSSMMGGGPGRGGRGGGGGRGMGMGGGGMGFGGAMSDSGFAQKVRAEREKLYKGLPLKTVTVTKTTRDGQTNTVTTTVTISNFKTADVADAMFTAPEGYKKMEMPQWGGRGGN